MKTKFERMYNKKAKPFEQEFKKAQIEYEALLKEFIQNTLTGGKGFKDVYKDHISLAKDFKLFDGAIDIEPYEVMETVIREAIIDFEMAKEEDPIGNKDL